MSQYDGLKNKKILLVEDVELNQYLAKHIIESWGCIVDVVENGELAVERISASSYDLILMDIQMPVMDGVEATKLIRSMKDETKSGIPIIALTANALKTDGELYLKIGMNDWLAKPFEEPSLFNIINRNLKKIPLMNTAPAPAEVKLGKAEPVAESKLYDLTMIKAISGGDDAFIQKMLELFLETVPVTLGELKNSVDKKNWMMLSKHAHKLKSTIDSMGIVHLKKDIRAIEAGGKSGAEPAVLQELVDKVIQVMHQVMEQVRKDARGG